MIESEWDIILDSVWLDSGRAVSPSVSLPPSASAVETSKPGLDPVVDNSFRRMIEKMFCLVK